MDSLHIYLLLINLFVYLFTIYLFICYFFTGKDGVDSVLPTSTVEGGKGGILINGTGPLADPGGGNISAAGGAGYGAGGGAGGAVYFVNGPLIYSGGNGTDGVVYVEMVDPGTTAFR